MQNSEASADYPFNCEEDVEQVDLCILCCSRTVKVSSLPQNNDQLLSRNLNVIFLVRKVLQVPVSQLEENVQEFGDPVNWIRLCEQCSQLTRQAEELHWKIVKIKEQLRSLQKLIVEKARVPCLSLSSSLSPSSDNQQRNRLDHWKREKLWRRTRAFISTYDYDNPINPFVDGDKLANYLLSQKSFGTPSPNHLFDKKLSSLEELEDDEHVIKVEVDHLQDDKDNEDVDWEPPEMELEDDDKQAEEVPLRSATIIPPKRSYRKRNKYAKINGKFKCPSCDKEFNSVASAYRHEKAEHEHKPYKKAPRTRKRPGAHPPLPRRCDLCGHGFSRQSRLNLHFLFRHKDHPATVKLREKGYQLFRCKVSRCTAYYTNQDSMDKHIKKVHSSFDEITKSATKFSCRFCGKILGCKATLEHHEQSVHESVGGGDEKRYKCELCHLGFRSSPSLEEHKRRVHSIGKRGPYKKTMDNGGGKRVKKLVESICHLCGKIYKDRLNLRKHLVSHHPEDALAKQLIEEGFGVWNCKVAGCGATYVKRERLEEHVEKVHGGKDGDEAEHILFCAFCGKGFFGRKCLQLHEKLLHQDNLGGKMRFKCQFCGFEVANRSYLDGHIQRVHKPSKKNGGEVKGEKVVICDICGMQFWERDKLDKHKIIHDKEAEQPHACDICGRAYSTHESMWKHKRKIHKIYRRPEDSRIKK